MSLESDPIRVPGNTRMCVLPFTTPSVEPDGGVRLCSAASITNYLDETMMGNIRHGGLETVWRNEKFRKLRESLLTGDALPPYCNHCDYRFEGPTWLLVFHLALHTWHRAETQDPDIARLIRRHRHRYAEYQRLAPTLGLGLEPLPELDDSGHDDSNRNVLDLLAEQPRQLTMAGDDQWVDLVLEVSPATARALATAAELSIAWRVRGDAQTDAAPNLRVSFEEEDPDRIRHAFPAAAAATESATIHALADFETTVDDFAPQRVVRVRVGGFGPAGIAIELSELALLLPAAASSETQRGIEKLSAGKDLAVAIDLNTLNRCNVSCTMCPYAIKYDDHGDAKDPIYRLTLDEYKDITNGMNVESAHFVGAYAEPLMNKELFAMIEHAGAQGSRTAVTSNAMLMNRKFAEKIVDSGLGILTISLHGATKAVAEGIMRGADFDKVLDNIRTLQEVKRERGASNPTIQINYVGQRTNVQDLPAFVELCDSLDVRIIHFVHLLTTPGVAEGESLVLFPRELTQNVRKAEVLAKRLGVQLYVSSSYTQVIEDFESGKLTPTEAAAQTGEQSAEH
ncbi:MAG: radical SAM protein [bacterium]|nr:radical SAM protein [bacterium]